MHILSELTVNPVYYDITIGYTNRLCGVPVISFLLF